MKFYTLFSIINKVVEEAKIHIRYSSHNIFRNISCYYSSNCLISVAGVGALISNLSRDFFLAELHMYYECHNKQKI
ncbi:hypothetical protein GLOIN_2v1640108, partial [Rhizophagus irregularis DAOM 181602=DAOM 197198]